MTDLWLFEIFGTIWYFITKIYYYRKFHTLSLKSDSVLTILNIWYLVFCGKVWHGIVWYILLVLPRSTTMKNFGLLTWKLTEYGHMKYLVFGMIWYFMVWYGMVLYGMVCWYYLALLPYKISDSSLENWLCYGRLKYLVFGILWDGLAWYSMVYFVGIT